jgi:selenocysteine lyase/cysteine desulfurase
MRPKVADLGVDFFAAATREWIFALCGCGIAWARARSRELMAPGVPSVYSLAVYDAWKRDGLPGKTHAALVSPGGFKRYAHQWATT